MGSVRKNNDIFAFYGIYNCCRPETLKIMFSISQFYCRGLIYQARSGRFTHGFDESNREASTIEFMSIFS